MCLLMYMLLSLVCGLAPPDPFVPVHYQSVRRKIPSLISSILAPSFVQRINIYHIKQGCGTEWNATLLQTSFQELNCLPSIRLHFLSLSLIKLSLEVFECDTVSHKVIRVRKQNVNSLACGTLLNNPAKSI